MRTAAQLFDVEHITWIREQAADAWRDQLTELPPEGWSRSPLQFRSLLALFPPLSLRSGMLLRAYQYRSGNNGEGIVWGMPADAPFPTPDACPVRDPPQPPLAQQPLAIVQSDSSPRACLMASLLARELQAVGTFGHGNNWNTHRVLGEDPWLSDGLSESVRRGPTTPAQDWVWHSPRPTEWQPSVTRTEGETVVTLHTSSGLGSQQIHRHRDIYAHSMRPTSSTHEIIASGPRGFTW